MKLSLLLKELQNAAEVSEDGDTSDISVVVGDKEYPLMFMDFEEDHYAKGDKMKIKLYTKS